MRKSENSKTASMGVSPCSFRGPDATRNATRY
jgi:hypothetical protein